MPPRELLPPCHGRPPAVRGAVRRVGRFAEGARHRRGGGPQRVRFGGLVADAGAGLAAGHGRSRRVRQRRRHLRHAGDLRRDRRRPLRRARRPGPRRGPLRAGVVVPRGRRGIGERRLHRRRGGRVRHARPWHAGHPRLPRDARRVGDARDRRERPRPGGHRRGRAPRGGGPRPRRCRGAVWHGRPRHQLHRGRPEAAHVRVRYGRRSSDRARRGPLPRRRGRRRLPAVLVHPGVCGRPRGADRRAVPRAVRRRAAGERLGARLRRPGAGPRRLAGLSAGLLLLRPLGLGRTAPPGRGAAA
jgi:hypothetical protein